MQLAEMAQATDRAAALARRLLTFSRQQEPSRRPTKLGPLTEEVLGLIRPMLSQRELALEMHVDDDLPEIRADPT
ncbi:MAG: hypothetical protein GWN73_29665, partial [Actinobacteria bacterium]|nr:hypothetical protein [Actinomycetota bacterium]NIU69339.1 hypothetical protein [Actinomycetota bacterium]NIV89308.1 hypothetical protein [Actinomycetota bacterium]NIW31202.1 hypothetical protein [Actinomycetota bacterium]NIX52581.1 hypothetical protein [Actinomycetota bacterium]